MADVGVTFFCFILNTGLHCPVLIFSEFCAKSLNISAYPTIAHSKHYPNDQVKVLAVVSCLVLFMEMQHRLVNYASTRLYTNLLILMVRTQLLQLLCSSLISKTEREMH